MSRFDIEMPSLDFDEQERQEALANDIDDMSEEEYECFYEDDNNEINYINEILYENSYS